MTTPHLDWDVELELAQLRKAGLGEESMATIEPVLRGFATLRKEYDVRLVRQHLAWIRVCVPKTLSGEKLAELMAALPTGASFKWALAIVPPGMTNVTNPGQCASDPQRLHYQFEC